MRKKGRVYQAVVRSTLLYDNETWPVRVAYQRMLVVFGNDRIRRFLNMGRSGRVPTAELPRRLRLTSMPAQLVQRRLRWYSHSPRRPNGALMIDLLQPTQPRMWLR